jgi:hypothetical protein
MILPVATDPSILHASLPILYYAGGTAAACLACHGLAQRWLNPAPAEDAATRETFGQALGLVFAMLFALTTVSVWNNYDRLDASAAREADLLRDLNRDLEAYPASLREPGRRLLQAYLQRVVKVEWPVLERGGRDAQAEALIAQFNRLLIHYRPAGMAELPRHEEMLRLVDQHRDLRQARVQGAGSYLDTSMWESLLGVSVIFLGFWCLHRARHVRTYRLQLAALGAMVGLVLYMMAAYNNPFRGPEAIRPAAFQELLDGY